MSKKVYELRALGRCFRGESVETLQQQLDHLRRDEGWTFEQLRDKLRAYLLDQQAKRRLYLAREMQRYQQRKQALAGEPQADMDELVDDLQRVGYIAVAKRQAEAGP